MEPILDFHTHAQNVYGRCEVTPWLRPWLKSGFARLYEKTGFHPLIKKMESSFTLRMIIREMQCRFAAFGFDDYLAAMARNGVTYSCDLPVEPLTRTRELLAWTKSHPHVIPFASVDFSSGEDPVAQLRAQLQAGCRGLKLHPILQNISPRDERVRALFEYLRDYDYPVLFHTGPMPYFLHVPHHPEYAEPEDVRPLLRDFPNQTVILGHMGLLANEPALALANAFRQVYVELSFQPVAKVRRALQELGSGRLLLGSDWPASEPATEIAIVTQATRRDAAARRKILCENGAELLRRAGVELPA